MTVIEFINKFNVMMHGMGFNSNNSSTREIPDYKDSDSVWNFAYGSNMHPQKRTQRGNIAVLEVMPGILENWKLVFNLPGIRLIEPAMASIEPERGHQVHGVLLRLKRQEFDKLVRSEGGSEYYELINCEVNTYDGRVIKALAFKTREELAVKQDLVPSKRYMNLIRQGAVLSQLDSQYCQWLAILPHREDSLLVILMGSLLIEFLTLCIHMRLSRISASYLKLLQWCECRLSPPVGITLQSILLAPALAIALTWRPVRYFIDILSPLKSKILNGRF